MKNLRQKEKKQPHLHVRRKLAWNLKDVNAISLFQSTIDKVIARKYSLLQVEFQTSFLTALFMPNSKRIWHEKCSKKTRLEFHVHLHMSSLRVFFDLTTSATFSSGNYYLASSFHKVFMGTAGTLPEIHAYVVHPFLKNLFDKLAIVPRFNHTGNLKTFANLFTEDKITPEHK